MHQLLSSGCLHDEEERRVRHVLRAAHRRAVMGAAVAACILLAALLLWAWLFGGDVDACTMTRADRQRMHADGRGLWFTGDAWLHGLRVCVIAALGVHAVAEGATFSAYAHVRLAAATVLFYSAAILWVLAAKHALGDEECSTKPNSVSGHVTMYVFWALALPRVGIEGYRTRVAMHNKLWCTFYACYVAVALGKTHRTVFHGYHTPRQLLYGAFCAVASAAAFARSVDADHAPTGRMASPSHALLQRSGIAAVAACAVGTLVGVPAWRLAPNAGLALGSAGVAWAAGLRRPPRARLPAEP